MVSHVYPIAKDQFRCVYFSSKLFIYTNPTIISNPTLISHTYIFTLINPCSSANETFSSYLGESYIITHVYNMHIYRFDQILHILTLPLSYLNSNMTSCHSSICVVRSSLIMLSTIFIETGVNFFSLNILKKVATNNMLTIVILHDIKTE